MLRWSTKGANGNGQYKDWQLTKHTHRYHHNHLHHHPLHSQHWHDSRCRLTDPHINLFCILLTITPATPGLNIFPYFRQKILCNQENFVKKGISEEAVMFWSFPEAWVLFYWLGGFHSQQNTTMARLHTHPRQHNHKSKHDNPNTKTWCQKHKQTPKPQQQKHHRFWESNTKSITTMS